jgi:hypothetical protein
MRASSPLLFPNLSLSHLSADDERDDRPRRRRRRTNEIVHSFHPRRLMPATAISHHKSGPNVPINISYHARALRSSRRPTLLCTYVVQSAASAHLESHSRTAFPCFVRWFLPLSIPLNILRTCSFKYRLEMRWPHTCKCTSIGAAWMAAATLSPIAFEPVLLPLISLVSPFPLIMSAHN